MCVAEFSCELSKGRGGFAVRDTGPGGTSEKPNKAKHTTPRVDPPNTVQMEGIKRAAGTRVDETVFI